MPFNVYAPRCNRNSWQQMPCRDVQVWSTHTKQLNLRRGVRIKPFGGQLVTTCNQPTTTRCQEAQMQSTQMIHVQKLPPDIRPKRQSLLICPATQSRTLASKHPNCEGDVECKCVRVEEVCVLHRLELCLNSDGKCSLQAQGSPNDSLSSVRRVTLVLSELNVL